MSSNHNLHTGIFLSLLVIFIAWMPAKDHQVEKLDASINTKAYDEISPVISQDGQTLYFTRIGYPDFDKTLVIEGEDISKHPSEGYYNMQLAWVYEQLSGEKMKRPELSTLNQDIWMSRSQEGRFTEAIHPGSPLNNALPNSICALSKNGKEMIVINQFEPDGGMQPGFSKTTQGFDGTWCFPKPIDIEGFQIDNDEVSVSINNEGRLMLISMQDDRSLGDHDIYISKKIGIDRWSKPIHLGSVLNSKYREVAPQLSDDGRTIYFSSNRPGGLGGMDIYYSVRQGQGWKEWSKPRKFYHPINSKYDDSQPRFNEATGYLYFASRRAGSSDIYRAKIEEPSILNYAFETIEIAGKVINKGNQMPIEGQVEVKLLETGKVFASHLAQNGLYRVKIPKGQDVEVRALIDGFISHSKYFSFQKDRDYDVSQTIDLFLEPIRKGKMIGHAPIYFDRSSSRFSPTALPELRRLAQLLVGNSNLSIEIQGHTDNIGKEEDLVLLSLERANAVREFLAKQGVSVDRLSIKGLGPKFPITSNVDETSRSKNRRVEIKIAQISESKN